MKIGFKSSNAFSAKYLIIENPPCYPIIQHALESLFISRVSLVEYLRTQGSLTPVAEMEESENVANFCPTCAQVVEHEHEK